MLASKSIIFVQIRGIHQVRECLRLTPIRLDDVPKLTNFQAAKDYFAEKVLRGNKEMDHPYVAPTEVISAFQQIFPEIVESRGITKLPKNAFDHWRGKKNEVLLELDSDEVKVDDHVNMLAIGGPSTLAGALLYKLRHPSDSVIHANTSRHDSNHDGSAYYFHERDAFPVYINKVNRGPYCVYADLKKRLMPAKKLLESAIHDRHHVKISLNWFNIKPSMIFGIFIPNLWHMIQDIYIKDPKDTLMRHTVEHAKRAHDIIDTITKKTGLKRQAMLLQGKDKACYVGFAGFNDPEEHFAWLNTYTHIPFHVIDHTKCFGKDVEKVVTFPRDGLVSPWIFENLSGQIQKSGGQVKRNFQVEKLLVKRNGPKGIKVSKVVWKDSVTQKRHTTAVDKVILSLGPSALFRVVPPKYSLWNHLRDIFYQTSSNEAYDSTFTSLLVHAFHKVREPFFKETRVLNGFMYAAGSTSVVMVGINIAKVTEERLEVFTKFLDGVNQHWTPIAKRDVEVKGKTYRFFAIQMTGGGNFPSRKIRPDYLVSLLHTTEKTYGLDEVDDIMYDCIQTRGCGRGVSAKNSVAFNVIADNAVVCYAQGGIGMTTMFPNGECLIQLLENALGEGVGDRVNGLIGNERLQKSLYNQKNVLEGIDFTHLVDKTGTAAKLFGWQGEEQDADDLKLSGHPRA